MDRPSLTKLNLRPDTAGFFAYKIIHITKPKTLATNASNQSDS